MGRPLFREKSIYDTEIFHTSNGNNNNDSITNYDEPTNENSQIETPAISAQESASNNATSQSQAQGTSYTERLGRVRIHRSWPRWAMAAQRLAAHAADGSSGSGARASDRVSLNALGGTTRWDGHVLVDRLRPGESQEDYDARLVMKYGHLPPERDRRPPG